MPEAPVSSLTFGFDPAAADSVILKVTRSTDLENFDTTILSNEWEPFPDHAEDMLLRIEDPEAPHDHPAFYRLEVTPRR